ncbi:MAG TPA: amidohydrolase family protein [Bryobacteraceae bacterium]|nr:amidohydrolase family protein [Bryobacteraceae bacterium]
MTDAAGRMCESPWGPLEVRDAHVHFFSHRFFSTLVAQKPGLSWEAAEQKLGWQLPAQEPERLAETWVHELDRYGVAGAALIASVPGDESSVTAAVRAFPERFAAYAMVNPREWHPETFSEVRVVCLFPAMHRYSLHDESVRPVFDWAQTNQRAVLVHCGVLRVGVRDKLDLPSLFDLRYSNPTDVHAVALRYPDVPIVVPHFGAGYFREALMLADQCPNVYLDTSSSNQWMKYQESRLDLRQVFRRALDVVGPARLLFGTDSSYFPRGWHQAIFEQQARALYELDVSASHARAIFGQNLLRILSR